MQIFTEIGPIKAYLKHQRNKHLTVGLVPTMGALHGGHLSLIETSKNENDITVCSIYVNPAQFNNPSDLEKYPRTPERDIQMLDEAGCDIVFAPANKEMYQQPSQLKFDFGSLDKILEGKFRPGHFSGVALVVSKFFNIIQPTKAYFGQKDFQQFKVISKLVEELKFDLGLVCAPIVREADGLAMSSRNMRLSPEQRQKAVVLSQVLHYAKAQLLKGETFTSVRNGVTERFLAQALKLEYFEIADKENLLPLENIEDPGRIIILVAAFVGEIRLIDNLLLIEN